MSSNILHDSLMWLLWTGGPILVVVFALLGLHAALRRAKPGPLDDKS